MNVRKLVLAGMVASFALAACSNPLSPRFPQPQEEEDPPSQQDDQTSMLEAPGSSVSTDRLG